MKWNVLHELKINDWFQRNEAKNKITKKAYQGFGSTINIIGISVIRTQSKEWDPKINPTACPNCTFATTEISQENSKVNHFKFE